MGSTTSEPTTPRGISEWIACRAGVIKWFSAGLIVLALLVLMRTLPLERVTEAFKAWIDGLGMWGPVVLGLCYVAATLLFLPGWVLTIAAGALYGLITGTIVVSIGSTTGAALAFLIARYLARERVSRQIARYPKFAAVDRAIGEQGWKIVALLRLSPAVPFNLQNYLYGLTAIRFWPCVLTSWLAMLPGTFLYVYIGSVGGAAVKAAAEGKSPAGWGEWTARIVGLVATVAVTVYVTRIAHRAMRKTTAIEATDNAAAHQENSPADKSVPPQRRAAGALLTLMVAVLILTAAVWAYLQQETVRTYLEQLLSTPSQDV